jgi:L-lactate dehydrogenase complex protein LldG
MMSNTEQSGTDVQPVEENAARASLLRQVREAVRQGRQYRVRVPDDIPADVGYLGVEGSTADRLARELEAVGAHAHRGASPDAIAEVLRNLVQQHSVRSALCWQHPLLDRCRIAELLNELNVEMISRTVATDIETNRHQLFTADLGISSVDWAVAETGTLALCASPTQPPTASLVPAVHLALVEHAQILPDLFDLFAKLERDGLPSNLALITGPSKTGDIELKLTTGVHGPGEVHVVIVNEMATPETD